MRNEAASVEDAGWAREARTLARVLSTGQQFRLLLVGTALSISVAAMITLTSQWPVLLREAARNGVEVGDFLKWSVLGRPAALIIHSRGGDPAMPYVPLLLLTFMGAALASRLRWSHWVVLLAATFGVLSVASLTSLLGGGLLLGGGFLGFPGMALLLTLGTAALGLLLGQTFRQRRDAV